MLCIHACSSSSVSSYIKSDGVEIESGDSLKILGFKFNKEPNANYHVTDVINKLYSKL